MCCSHGVHLDLDHSRRILDEAELIKPHLPKDRHDVDNWFDGDIGEDSDFPSGRRIGTQVIPDPTMLDGTRCIFLRPDNLCALQVTSLALKRDRWDLKPFYCALYPIILLGDTVLLDDDNALYRNGANCQRAETVTVPLYQLFEDELVLAMGQERYDQLCSIAKSA
jgi:hypothetical protein